MKALATALLVLSACGSELPPYEALTLRDTLLANPEMIAVLPDASRAALRDRFSHLPPEAERAVDVHAGTALERLHHFDGDRETHATDAAVFVRLSNGTVTPLIAGPADAVRLPPFEATDATPLESAALAGDAGKILTNLAEREGTQRLIRVSGWPVAAAVDGPLLYVNASWLNAMAASPVVVSSAAAAGRVAARVVRGPARDVAAPVTYDSISECESDRDARCEQCTAAPSTCDPLPVLSDFTSAADECVFIAQSGGVLDVCHAIALERSDITRCMQRNQPDCLPSSPADVHTRAFLDSFAGKPMCAATLDKCIASPSFTYQISCESLCNACSCHTNACSGPSCSAPSCSNNNCNIGSCKTCSTAGAAAPVQGWLGMFWLGLPLVFLWRRSRR